MKTVHVLRNIAFVATFVLLLPFWLLFVFPVVFLPASLRFRARWYYGATGWCMSKVLHATGLTFQIKGRELLALLNEQPGIIVLNHQSVLDSFVAESLLGSLPRLYFSNDYSKVPLLGFALRRMHVIVKRLSARASQQSLDDATAIAAQYQTSIVIFPEGTRHADGEIHKFYRGFAVLAQRLNYPVIPVFLHGLHRVRPKGSSLLQELDSKVHVTVGKPFVFDEKIETQEEFLAKVHNWFTMECARVKSNQ